MSIVLKNEKGEDIEAMTPEEAEAETQKKIIEERAKWDATNPDKAEVIKLQDELASEKAERAKLENKDTNFSNLRKSKEESDTKIASLEKSISDMKANSEQTIVNDAISLFVGNDEEMKKKVQFHFDRIVDKPTDKSGLQKKVKDAWNLAVGENRPSPLDSLSSSGGPLPMTAFPSERVKLSESAKSVATKFGITDEDIKKADEYLNKNG